LSVTGICFQDLKAYIIQPCVKRVPLAPPAQGGEYDGLFPGDFGRQIDPEGELRVEWDRLKAFQHKAFVADVGEVPYHLSRSIIYELDIEGGGTSTQFSSFPA
jgi:hypothetical protein